MAFVGKIKKSIKSRHSDLSDFRKSFIAEEDEDEDDSYFYFDLDEYLITGDKGKRSDKKKKRKATVILALIESTGRFLQLRDAAEEEDDKRLFFCRIKLGTEKRKTKIVKASATAIYWNEMFSIELYDDSTLEIDLWDRDQFLGRIAEDLNDLENEVTHRLQLDFLNPGAPRKQVNMYMLLTITGTNLNTFIDKTEYNIVQKQLNSKFKKFSVLSLTGDWEDVGYLTVFIYGTKGLVLGGEYYCVVELENDRRQTPVDYYYSTEQQWMKLCHFTVRDVTNILLISVWEDRKGEEVARVKIPLLDIKNRQRKWYGLKDVTLKDRAKGDNPRILLEMRFSYNIVKSSFKLLKPNETRYITTLPKFERQVLNRNWSRLRAVMNWIRENYKQLRRAFQWESQLKNFLALNMWIIFCLNFRAWMLSLLLLIPFFFYRNEQYLIQWQTCFGDMEKSGDKSTKSLRRRITDLQDTIQNVQNLIGSLASKGERIKNLFNFTVPFISIFCIICCVSLAILTYFIPWKYILIGWAIRKYLRRIWYPNKKPHSEIAGILERVPDDEILFDCRLSHIHLDDEEEFEDAVTYFNKRMSTATEDSQPLYLGLNDIENRRVTVTN